MSHEWFAGQTKRPSPPTLGSGFGQKIVTLGHLAEVRPVIIGCLGLFTFLIVINHASQKYGVYMFNKKKKPIRIIVFLKKDISL